MSHNHSLKKIKKQIYTSVLTREKFVGMSNTCYCNMPLFQTLEMILNFKKSTGLGTGKSRFSIC